MKKCIYVPVCNTYMWGLSLVQIQPNGKDMALASRVLVIVIIATATAKTFSLPPVNFLKEFAIKYQRSSIVMNLPKEVSRNQILKR